jgi:hypothetical protein
MSSAGLLPCNLPQNPSRLSQRSDVMSCRHFRALGQAMRCNFIKVVVFVHRSQQHLRMASAAFVYASWSLLLAVAGCFALVSSAGAAMCNPHYSRCYYLPAGGTYYAPGAGRTTNRLMCPPGTCSLRGLKAALDLKNCSATHCRR